MSPEWNEFEKRSLDDFARKKSEEERKRKERATRSDETLSRIREENDALRFALGLDREGFESALNNEHYKEIMLLAIRDNLTWNESEKRFSGTEAKLIERRESLLGEIVKSLRKQTRRRTEPSNRSGLSKRDNIRINLYTDDHKGIKHNKRPSKNSIIEKARFYAIISELGISRSDYIGGYMTPDGTNSDQEEDIW